MRILSPALPPSSLLALPFFLSEYFSRYNNAKRIDTENYIKIFFFFFFSNEMDIDGYW